MVDKKAIYFQDLNENQQLTGIVGYNISKQCEIILETNVGPDLLVSANIISRIVNRSSLLRYKDASELIADSEYNPDEVQFAQGGEVDFH